MKASKEHKPQQSRVIPNYTHPIQKVSNKEKLEFYQMCDLAYIMAYNARNNVDYNTRFFSKYFNPTNAEISGDLQKRGCRYVVSIFRRIMNYISNTINPKFDIHRFGHRNTYAYVDSNDIAFHRIHLCNAYKKANIYGVDSKPGVIIHELSHFSDIGGTEDHAYGDDAKNLNMESAIDNADNYEYAAENAW